jgi:hypothetical protein
MKTPLFFSSVFTLSSFLNFTIMPVKRTEVCHWIHSKKEAFAQIGVMLLFAYHDRKNNIRSFVPWF